MPYFVSHESLGNELSKLLTFETGSLLGGQDVNTELHGITAGIHTRSLNFANEHEETFKQTSHCNRLILVDPAALLPRREVPNLGSFSFVERGLMPRSFPTSQHARFCQLGRHHPFSRRLTEDKEASSLD